MSSTNKIVVSGVPLQYSQEELDKRVAAHQFAYTKTSQSCITVRGSHPKEFFQNVIDRAAEGYTLTDYPSSLSPTDYSLSMRKPESLQADDLLQITADVKAKYRLELEASHESYKELLFKQLVQAEELKQERLQQATKDKLMAKLKKEADGCYQPLNFPE